jgi:hypothetical protein
MLLVAQFANEILDMRERIENLEMENHRLRRVEEEYHELLNSTLQHNEKMVDALDKNRIPT